MADQKEPGFDPNPATIKHVVGGCTFEVPSPKAKGFVKHTRALLAAAKFVDPAHPDRMNIEALEASIDVLVKYCVDPKRELDKRSLIDDFSDDELAEATQFVFQKKVPSASESSTS